MTGTGTQTDPFIIQNWDDFYDVTDSASYYKLGCDLDANDYNDGVWTACTLTCKELDGDAHEIRNINYNVQSPSLDVPKYAILAAGTNTIKNISFKDFYSNSGFLKAGTSANVNVENCEFSGNAVFFASGTGSSSGYYGRLNFYDSIITFKGSCFGGSTSSYADHTKTFTRCHIYSDTSSPVTTQNKTFCACEFYTCRIEGKCKPTQYDAPSLVQNCIIALENVGDELTSWVFVGKATDISVVDSTLAKAAVSGTGIVPLTTQQMQSADELNANGFVVIEI
ncbi:MAG: hypothetical protein IJO29_01570 [Oscillospiraceae bacterium]|nr:hypothetical protein [Oscillospiraceae bacterium]